MMARESTPTEYNYFNKSGKPVTGRGTPESTPPRNRPARPIDITRSMPLRPKDAILSITKHLRQARSLRWLPKMGNGTAPGRQDVRSKTAAPALTGAPEALRAFRFRLLCRLQ